MFMPVQLAIVEADLDGWLHDDEIGGNIEIAGYEQRMMAYPQDLPLALGARFGCFRVARGFVYGFDRRQDG